MPLHMGTYHRQHRNPASKGRDDHTQSRVLANRHNTAYVHGCDTGTFLNRGDRICTETMCLF
jgi:hypothetical protein